MDNTGLHDALVLVYLVVTVYNRLAILLSFLPGETNYVTATSLFCFSELYVIPDGITVFLMARCNIPYSIHNMLLQIVLTVSACYSRRH